MALIKCRECGDEISSLAICCPHCGATIENIRHSTDDIQGISRCPVCALDVDVLRCNKRSVEKDGENTTEYLCRYCNSWIRPIKTKYGMEYYAEKADYDGLAIERIIVSEIKTNPLFDTKMCDAALKNKIRITNEDLRARWSQQDTATHRRPVCPTCGSAHVEKISVASKIAGASMFGILSRTARSQFKCKDCGYKW